MHIYPEHLEACGNGIDRTIFILSYYEQGDRASLKLTEELFINHDYIIKVRYSRIQEGVLTLTCNDSVLHTVDSTSS